MSHSRVETNEREKHPSPDKEVIFTRHAQVRTEELGFSLAEMRDAFRESNFYVIRTLTQKRAVNKYGEKSPDINYWMFGPYRFVVRQVEPNGTYLIIDIQTHQEGAQRWANKEKRHRFLRQIRQRKPLR